MAQPQTQDDALAVVTAALVAVMNCEGVARRGARREFEENQKLGGGYTEQTCVEFDYARGAFEYLRKHGHDVIALSEHGERVAR